MRIMMEKSILMMRGLWDGKDEEEDVQRLMVEMMGMRI